MIYFKVKEIELINSIMYNIDSYPDGGFYFVTDPGSGNRYLVYADKEGNMVIYVTSNTKYLNGVENPFVDTSEDGNVKASNEDRSIITEDLFLKSLSVVVNKTEPWKDE